MLSLKQPQWEQFCVSNIHDLPTGLFTADYSNFVHRFQASIGLNSIPTIPLERIRHQSMRRSKRLAARKGLISETEGRSQKDIVESTKKDEDFSNLKDPVSTHDFVIDKTPSKVVFGLDLEDKIRIVGHDRNDREINVDDSREKGDDSEGKDDNRTRVAGRRRGLRNLSDHEEEEEEEDFITLSTLSEKTVGKK